MSSSKSMTRRRFVGHVAATSAAAAVPLVAYGDTDKSNPAPFRIGAASCVINPNIGDWVQSASVKKRATAIRDNLEANGLYLSDGKRQVLLVSCDLGGLEPPRVVAMRQAMGRAAGIPPRDIVISATHTRGPVVLRTNYLMPVDDAYLDRLQGWLVELAQQAIKSARPGKIGWGKGTAQIGFIGDVALVTEPCELYCQFGLDIKRRSPAPITAVVGLADGYCGYCPTIYGILGGGYTGEPISWTRLEPYAGYKIVETAGSMLNSLWSGGETGETSK